ncbi:hypothetical protein SERLA73DRAFT_179742 [Serpula lacrymans var. lacrymans S7.3]|uniref:Cytochrome P450 n=2 Tax=Serpula lacrymans var. lacrymans TaxID=341189 RepID=F8PU07_SERL3|nr:uncharacterized protein SERLADRAFT_464994 [Serpula lacrymans var. lacrymans S7.9]EGN99632.1 hypothetical protein SERLA73DRAFT_179742 [Serpula lacrymans var. lacrymans S7.3]EGO25197.1 hypothetical protein SERLADRAFT_464994 [Serpula lacrymans var. lacrymans S7.9]
MLQPTVTVDSKALASLICVLLIGGALVKRTLRIKSTLPLPPSPEKNHWLWGHVLPVQYGFLQVEQWIKELGPVVHVRYGRESVVIVGRHQAAIDIMERQGGSTVDRPRSVAAGDMLSGGLRMLFSPSGDRFRRMRRAVHTHLQPKAAETYEPIQMDNAKNTIFDLLDSPDKYTLHARRYAASVIQKVAYGKTTPTSGTDPEVQHVRLSLDRLRHAMRPGQYFVDTFPFLKHLPWYGRELKKWHQDDLRLYTSQLGKVQKQLESNQDVGPSFGKYLLESSTEHGLSNSEMAYLAGSFFAAGSDTTAVAICAMIVSAAVHPEAQAKVQEELDNVIGRQRAPTYDDVDMLPQLQAFIQESLRWRPIVPQGLGHRVNKDVIWGNYLIPAGTTVFGNHWAISRDPDVYPNPENFEPQRWLDSQEKVREDLKFPTFGFGRRVCPGQHVANRSVLINTLLILWAFRLSLEPSEKTNDMAFMNVVIPKDAPKVHFEKRIDENQLRFMMERYSEL